MKQAGRALWWFGEAAVTFGVVVLLLVAHALWWTDVHARAGARREVAALERRWDAAAPAPGPAGTSPSPPSSDDTSDDSVSHEAPSAGDGPPAPRWETAYAIIRIPAVGVVAPVAEGTSRAAVLDLGYVGHYPGTAQPGQPGNVALAGHRNTHGEPFRRIDRLRPGDTVVLETAAARFTYAVERTVPETSALDATVIAPVPYSSVHPGERMGGPGYYLTLTTCTPEFTSRYRLVVWARLRAGEPRQGPGALSVARADVERPQGS